MSRPITVSVGPNAAPGSTSPWVRFDDFGDAQVSIQADITGAADYTIQQTLDDPNSPTNPVPVGSVTWINHPDANLDGASAAVQGNYAYKPAFARILLNSGTGTVTATFTQAGGGGY